MKIRTVNGDIAPDQLGITSCHEHLIWKVPEPYQDEDPDLGFNSIQAAIAETEYFKSAGGKSLVEMTTKEIGRSASELQRISVTTGVHIIAATGHHKHKFSHTTLQDLTKEQIISTILIEINTGIDNTNVRAGVIKAATSLNKAYESELKTIQAVGIAQQMCGAPVSTHTEAGSFAIEQAKHLITSGVNPEKLLIGHLDRNLSMDTYLSLAKLGVYLGFDQIGKEKYWPDVERIKLIQYLIKAGYTQKILLSCDTARKSKWHTYNPSANGPAYLLMDFVTAMRAQKINEADIETMLIHNPSEFFAF